jgi:hypothetical protein
MLGMEAASVLRSFYEVPFPKGGLGGGGMAMVVTRENLHSQGTDGFCIGFD